MEIILAKSAGFCFGVDRAVKLTYDLLAQGRRVATLGPLIHNPQVVADLERRGALTCPGVGDVPAGYEVVIRSHGVPQSVYDALAARGLAVHDATCPFVAKIHRIAAEAAQAGVLLLVGGAYLLIRKVISLRIPLAFIGTVAVLAFLFPQGNDRLTWMAMQVLGGGVMLGAIFMATDYVTSPVTKWGQVLFGVGCGLITVVIRYFGAYNEGVSYAILVMNACVVLLDKVGRPVKFGAPKKEAAK